MTDRDLNEAVEDVTEVDEHLESVELDEPVENASIPDSTQSSESDEVNEAIFEPDLEVESLENSDDEDADPLVEASEEGEPDSAAEVDDLTSGSVATSESDWSRATGALLLGALDPAEAAMAGKAIAEDGALRAEIVSLLPVADILTSLYQTQPVTTAAQESVATAAGSTGVARAQRTERPKGQPVTIPKGQRLSPAAFLAIGLGVLAALGILGALAQRDQAATRQNEINALQTRVAELEIGGNASVFVLNPVSEDGAGAKATVFYSPGDGTVLLSASGLPQIDDDEVYQVWYQSDGDESWQPGPTFRVNASGEIVRRLGSDVPGFARMALTVEPAPGSAEQSGDVLLQGELVRSGDQ